MKFSSADVGFFLLDGYDLLGVETEFDVKIEDLFSDAQPLNGVWNASKPTGTKRAAVMQSGFFDDAVGSVHDVVGKHQSTRRVVVLGHEGNTVGKTMLALAGAYAGVYTLRTQRNQLQLADAEYRLDGAAERPVIVQALGAAAGDGNSDGEPVDSGASSANGGAAYLEVTAITLSGRPSVTIAIRHSADGITFVDLIAFTAVSARGAERKVVAAGTTVNRYLACGRTWSGAGGAPTVTFVAGFARA